MKQYLLFLFTVLLLVSAKSSGQNSYSERARKYIEQYYKLAIAEQRRSGIPASITLGQGILETEAGASELMTLANNHFGIKCKNGWQGPTFSHTDDAPDECFKKYTCAAESYCDHTALLQRNPRYAPLFTISPTDYAGWAKCLKKCGYATNPQYAQNLIKIIEDYKLQDYTYSALDSSLMTRENNEIAFIPGSGRGEDTLPKPIRALDSTATANNKNSGQAALKTSQPVLMPNPAPATAKTVPPTDTGRKTALTQNVWNAGAHRDSVKTVVVRQSGGPVQAPLSLASGKDTAHKLTAQTVKLTSEGGNPGTRAETPIVEDNHIVMINGLKAFYAYKDEMLLQYAMKYHILYQQLLSFNDISDGPLPGNMYVYLERKRTRGVNAQTILREGETLLMASQNEGIQLKELRELNLLNPNEEPIAGSILELQRPATHKPAVRVSEITAHTLNSIVLTDERASGNNGDFISVTQKRPNTFADTAKPHLPATPSAAVIKPLAQPITDTLVKTASKHADTASSAPALATAEIKSGIRDSLERTIDMTSAAPESKAGLETGIATVPVTDKTQKFYTVKKGDTAFSIAKNNHISLDQLILWNNIADGQVKIGQNLQVKN